MRNAVVVFATCAAIVQSAAVQAAIFLRVGSDLACNFPTIQQAIDSVSNDDGPIFIYVNASQTWTNQQLEINSKNLSLYGGFADCSAPIPAGRTTLTGSDDASRPVLTIRGATSNVTLAALNLESNSNTGNSGGAGFGGAMAIRGGPHGNIGLINVNLSQSKARFGGGLYVDNEFSSRPDDVYVVVAGNSSLSGNHADYAGGGLWCSHAHILFELVDAGFFGNQTAGLVNGIAINGPGGGIRTESCNVDISGGLAGVGSVAFNVAGGNGGGISASGDSLVRLFSLVPESPVGVAQNIAGGTGGAIDIESNSRVQAWDAIIEGNTARAGGGAIAIDEASNDGFDASLVMRGDLVDAPVGVGSPVVLCAPALRCNRIDNNNAVTTGNSAVAGGALLVHSGDGSVQSTAPKVTLYGTEIYANTGSSLITSSGDFAEMRLHGVAVFANSAGDYLIDVSAATSAFFGMYASTIAGNSSAGATSRSIQRSSVVGLNFINSIHWQPGKRIASTLGLGASDIDYVLANDALDGSLANHGTTADPQFANPAAQDYRLKLASPATDYAAASTDPTANHLPRVVDLGAVANQYGAQDLGAYERQGVCADDTIFCSGFDF